MLCCNDTQLLFKLYWSLFHSIAECINRYEDSLHATDFICKFTYTDFWQIHDGRSAGAHMLGRYCSKIPNITSTHNKIYLWFRTDHSEARGGFALTWNSTDPSMLHVYFSLLPVLISLLWNYTFRQSIHRYHTYNGPFHASILIQWFVHSSVCLYVCTCVLYPWNVCICLLVYTSR